jgi:c-di-GMP-related signal transduction protein
MVSNAMEFLVESKTNNIAAFGLLRLVYQNNISLKSIDNDILAGFELTYYQTILNFFKSIAGIKSQVIDSLPPTLKTFTSPMLRTFK